MKISKLFHWCYAFLMLMPIFAIGVTCLVNVFNKDENKVTYRYDTNDVYSISDLKTGNIYNLNLNYAPTYTTTVSVIQCSYVRWDNDYSLVYDYTMYDNSFISINENANTFTGALYVNNTWTTTLFTINKDSDSLFLNVVYRTYFNNAYFNCISKSNYIPIESVEKQTRNDIFYESIDKVKQDNLFSWASSSFIVAPFNYITYLFGVPNNSFLVLLLSYWLDVSIIWLVFDLIMYVPLLVHRWIDKGVLE